MDQGVNRSLKAKYRTKVVQKTIGAIDSKKLLQNVSLRAAMKMRILAWEEVNPNTVKNCFKKEGFSETEEGHEIHVSDDLFAALEDLIKHLGLLDESLNHLAVDDVTSFDDDLAVTQPPMFDEGILADILGTEKDQLEADEDDDSDPFEILEKLSFSQVRGAIDGLMNFGMAVGNAELQASIFVEANLASAGTQKKISQVHHNCRHKAYDAKY